MSTEETVFRLVHRLSIAHDKEEVLQQLDAIGEPAVEPLIAVLQEDDARAGYAAWALSRLRDARAVAPLLAKMQEDSGGPMFMLCAVAIGQIGDPSAVEPLLAILANADQLAEQHIEKLRAKAMASERPRFLMHIRCFLGRKYMRKLHDDLRDLTRRGFRRGAIAALGMIGDPRALEPISAYADSTDDLLRKAAQRSLTQLKTA